MSFPPDHDPASPGGARPGDEALADEAALREAAIRLLVRRECSRHELEMRLAAKGFEAAAIAACLDGLAERGLQSDARFAESFVRSRINRGQGPLKVRAELDRRGLARELATQAIRDAEVDWFALAAETLARRFDAPGDGPRERARRERFLAGRGFDFEQVRHALSCAWDD